jgi:ABC-type transporter Mla subunit MlaD
MIDAAVLRDDLRTLADLGNSIGQRHEETRRMLADAAESINRKMNEIDRLLFAAARLMQNVERTLNEPE